MARNKKELEEKAINIIDRLLEKDAITGSEAVTLIHAIIDKEENEPEYTFGTTWINSSGASIELEKLLSNGNNTGDYHEFNTTVTC